MRHLAILALELMESLAGQTKNCVGDTRDLDCSLSLLIRLWPFVLPRRQERRRSRIQTMLTFQVVHHIRLVLARSFGRRWFGCTGLVVMLIARNCQYPSPHSLPMNRLCFPRTVRLLCRRLVFCRHASIRPPAAIADKIASYYVVPRDVGTTHFASMGSSLDNLVAFLFHAVAELFEKVFIAVVDARMGHLDGLENAKHVAGFKNAINAFGAQRCVDLVVDRCQAWPRVRQRGR
ncbi:hypothetical protein FOFC_09152 [Fusarium oxysporum]|nr:hypothetical protein FOFC_09152 [Fusarium oxysporum]